MHKFLQGLSVGTAIFVLVAANVSCAQELSDRDYDIATQELKYSLLEFARQAGLELVAPSELLQGKVAPALHGHLSAREALDSLLRGTALTAEIREGTIFVEGRPTPPSKAAHPEEGQADILVTGSRIKGAVSTSPITDISRSKIEELGFTDIGAFARSLPQNFSGGQNPGVVSSVQTGSENTTSSSTLNLRGLGPDATLTLLNGHRLAYDAVSQGVDVNAVPLLAIDRIEVVADGASALYGSDAVGGVANIILRKDYSGLLTSARIGAATGGGDFQQQYSALTGLRWDSGGLMLAGDFNKASDIDAGQRDYTASVQPGLTLLPSQREISAVGVAHQQIGSVAEANIDAHFNAHRSRAALPFLADSPASDSGIISSPDVRSYSVTPKLSFSMPADWTVVMQGTRAVSDARIEAQIFFDGTRFAVNDVRYKNDLWSAEISAEGPLFALPGGDARLAFGAGLRSNGLNASIQQRTSSGSRSLLDYNDRQSITFGYGELGLPIAAPEAEVPLVRRLLISAAVRYEDYEHIGGVSTPKLGVIYQPISGLTFKGSWGKSFKAATLNQRNRLQEAILVPASEFLPSAPDERSVLLLAGGSRSLKPERATTWSLTAEIAPPTISGLKLEVSYFNIRYRNRVVRPIEDSDQAFGTVYSDLVDLNPSVADVLAATANAPFGVENQTDGPYDPANVGAIIRNQLQNAARQNLRGVDLWASYAFSKGASRFQINGQASYLESDQRLSAEQPLLQRAGIIFNPPHWRGRADAQWSLSGATLTAGYSFIGGIRDTRGLTTYRVASFHALDASAKFDTQDVAGPLSNVSLILAVQNLLNRKPSLIRSSGGTTPTYDATNYPSVGRLISLTVQKRW
jgi:outer membrane receptor protein involved in Fe transport